MTYTDKQDKTIELLGQGMSITSIAKTLRVSRKTVYSWIDLPGFKQAVREKTSDNLLKLGKRVIHVLNKNIDQIEQILEGKRATITERLRAYGMLLANVRPLSELGDLNERITALEKGTLAND
jgi:transposase